MNKNTRLVYSTNEEENRACPKCKELLLECICGAEVSQTEKGKGYKFVAVLRLEKSGRGGKTVTVIDQLPKQELFLKELSGFLKKKCGTGGTYILTGKEGIIEIQGDRREDIRKLLAGRAIKTKG